LDGVIDFAPFRDEAGYHASAECAIGSVIDAVTARRLAVSGLMKAHTETPDFPHPPKKSGAKKPLRLFYPS
jgi:hypothetical protein